MADEELSVVIDPPEPEPDVVVDKAAAAETATPDPSTPAAAVDPIAELKTQYADLEEREKRAREAGERARREAAEARRLTEVSMSEVQKSRLETITTALSAVQSDIERARADIKSAVEAGDAEAQADAYERLATAKSQIMRLEEGKADIEARKAAPPPKKAPSPSDPVEAYIQAAPRGELTTEWLRNHRDYITDQRKNTKLQAGHFDAISEGLSPDTPEYIRHVEQFLGLTKAAEAPPPKPAPVNGRRSPAPPVAPTANLSSNGGGTPEVRLSAREALAATDGTIVWNYDDSKGKFKKGDAIGVQEFARRKFARQQQGLE